MSTPNKRALIVAGGWPGHQPEKTAALLAADLVAAGFHCETATTLEPFADESFLRTFDVVSPCWTMGKLSEPQTKGLVAAVRAGVGLAGIHGGMGDAFRGTTDYEWMVGGHFVGHPHVGDYTVRVKEFTGPITRGLPATFAYRSEQYYLLVDPGVQVLADAEYLHEGRSCTMPVAWVKSWGDGRVFYSALGHDPAEYETFPPARELAIRGIRWAARELE
jgi:type 1 glutamine amidotransferase